MGLAVGDAAADGSADAGSVGGIDEVHIEADGDAGGVVHGVLERVGHDFAHAALVNVAHGEDVGGGFFDDFAFLGVGNASANDDDVAGFGLGLESAKIDQLGRAVAHDGGEGHAVDVSRGRGFGGVHVAVRVQPEVADLLFFLAEMVGDAGGHACGD